MSHPKLPYTYKSPLFVKISTLPLLVFSVVMLANLTWGVGTPSPDEALPAGPFFRSVLLLALTGVVAALGEVFVRKTVFTEEGVRHRTRLGTSYFKSYAQVASFKKATALRVVFDDGRKVKFEGGAAEEVYTILFWKAQHARPWLRG